MILDLGSGPWPKPDADIHIDFNDFPHVEVKHDLLSIPYPFPSEHADKIYLHDVIEHISVFDIQGVLGECYRILKPGGSLDITCPDVMWIVHRLVQGDWNDKAKGEWLHKFSDNFSNAMSYLFGGFYDPIECKQKGMGHIAGYSPALLFSTLKLSVSPNVWTMLQHVADPRNECILRVLATK
jgi:predicted SAM-dependent methyltransferase